MRYRVDAAGALAPEPVGADVVLATVWLTFLIGAAFIVMGTRAGQRWLQFWGGLTCVSCTLYLARGWLGLPGP